MADSDKAPDDKTLEKALRQAVFGARKRDPDHLTVNKVRTVTEKKLSLPEGFFKSEEWKTRSKDVIQQAAVRLNLCCAMIYHTLTYHRMQTKTK